ncbi:hypothetical protein BH09ACT6_BH09ACT6_15420 [soil metagenome]
MPGLALYDRLILVVQAPCLLNEDCLTSAITSGYG